MYKENSEVVVKDNNGIRDFVTGNFIQSCQIVSINITQCSPTFNFKLSK